jgi:hypothetical protein
MYCQEGFLFCTILCNTAIFCFGAGNGNGAERGTLCAIEIFSRYNYQGKLISELSL